MIDTQLQQVTNLNGAQKKKLKDVLQPVSQEIQEFHLFYKDAIRSDVFLLDKIVQYLLRQKGKQLRPALVMMSAKLFGSVNSRSFVAATMIELLHTATLIHDDVVDEANIRRDFLSINKLWKNKASVLLGDFLLSKGLVIALDHDEYRLLKVLSSAVKDMSEGELRQFRAFDVCWSLLIIVSYYELYIYSFKLLTCSFTPYGVKLNLAVVPVAFDADGSVNSGICRMVAGNAVDVRKN